MPIEVVVLTRKCRATFATDRRPCWLLHLANSHWTAAGLPSLSLHTHSQPQTRLTIDNPINDKSNHLIRYLNTIQYDIMISQPYHYVRTFFLRLVRCFSSFFRLFPCPQVMQGRYMAPWSYADDSADASAAFSKLVSVFAWFCFLRFVFFFSWILQ